MTRQTEVHKRSNFRKLFSFELCTHPPALFETPRLMRAANKPALANVVKTNIGLHHTFPNEKSAMSLMVECYYNSYHGNVDKPFVNCVNHTSNLSKSKFINASVVFDGYEGGPNTKDNVHGRRNTCTVETEVKFIESTKFRGKKKTFLTNLKINKPLLTCYHTS